MSNISKNLLLALAAVCAIAVIVFCIQLIVINRGVDPNEAGLASGSVSGEENPDDEDDPENIVTPSPTARPLPQGIRRTLLVTPSSRLVIYAREELFEFIEGSLDWWFIYTAGGVATLEITYTLIGTQGIEAHALSFLNNYSGGTEAVFNGEEMIQGSGLSGYHVTARHGGEVYEAWIHNLAGSDLALAFVINYQNDDQRDELYLVLSSLDIVGLDGGYNTGGLTSDDGFNELGVGPDGPAVDGLGDDTTDDGTAGDSTTADGGASGDD